jgi:hypothetical protein
LAKKDPVANTERSVAQTWLPTAIALHSRSRLSPESIAALNGYIREFASNIRDSKLHFAVQ